MFVVSAILDMFCEGRSRRVLLIRALGRWADALDEGLVIRMISSSVLTDDERDLFGRAFAELHGTRTELARRFGNVGGLFDSGPDWDALLRACYRAKCKRRILCCVPPQSRRLLKTYLRAGHEERLYGEHAALLDEPGFDFDAAGARILGRDLAGVAGRNIRVRLEQILEQGMDSARGEQLLRAMPLRDLEARRLLEVGASAGRVTALLPPGITDAYATLMDPVPALSEHTNSLLREWLGPRRGRCAQKSWRHWMSTRT